MRIGIIGAGHIGATLARAFVRAGNEVAVSNSRGPHTLTELADELGPDGRAVTVPEAADFGEVVVVSVPFGRVRELPAEGTEGKVLVDTTNYYPSRDGHVPELDSDETTSSELVAAHFPRARVVKAFNSIYWHHLRDRGRPLGDPGRIAVPISGDDPEAKDTVTTLVDQIGFDTVDAGPLAEGGRRHQPGTRVYTADLPTNELYARLH
jgi:8-hydroxy-5-deazaflavin:NADPH oxidoreductase